MIKPFLILSFIIYLAVQSHAATSVHRSNVSKDGEIVTVRGEGHVMFVRETNWIEASASQVLTAGDTLKTGSQGKMEILFIDGVQIKMHHKTTLVIREIAKDKKTMTLSLKVGEVWSRAKSTPDGLKVQTPSATAAIRGTDWDIVVDDKGTSYLTVLNGSVELFNDFGSVKVDTGQQAMSEVGKAPVKIFLVNPRDRVQWIISYSTDFVRHISFYTHRHKDALRLLPQVRKEAEADPDNLSARLGLAGLLYDLKEIDESLKIFDEVLIKAPENSKALVFKGLILFSRREADAAMPFFERAIKSANTDDRIKASLGMAGLYLYKNDLSKAEEILTQISNERDPVIGIALAQFQAYKGDFISAIKICEQYARDYPQDERFHILSADFYLTLDEPKRVEEAINRALAINPKASEAYALLGRYHYLAGRAKESEQAFKRALEIDPKNASALSEYGRLLMDKGEFERSIKKHDRAIQLNPGAHSYLSRRGMLLNWLEDIKGAERDYKRALEITSADYQSLDGLGIVALKQGRNKEAIEYFNKASLLEPKFAEPHIFLAIAYYQEGSIERALEELGLAKLLDPKDPLPHIIAYLIYQDTYRPLEAVKEARRALELLPNLKSVSPVEANQKGTTNLGSALLGLGMTEWATSYADESFNQYDAGSYFFSAIKYEGNPFIYTSTMSQGFLLNPISIRYSDRYQDIVPSPQQNLTVKATIGSEDGAFYRKNKLIWQGYVRSPFEFVYLIDWENYDNKGFRANSHTRSNFITYGFGGRPDYKNGFFIWGGFKNLNSGEPGTVSMPDLDDKNKETHYLFSAGYNYRVGSKNNILLNLGYNRLKARYNNSDPLGSTGITNPALSFIDRFGVEQARGFFDKGLFDIGIINGYQVYGTDTTGTLLSEGYRPISFPINVITDTNTVRNRTSVSENMSYQFKHLVTLGDAHDLSYGIEYVPANTFKVRQTYSVSPTGDYWLFYDGLFPLDNLYALRELVYRDTQDEWRYDSRTFLTYLNDRWRLSDSFILEGGLAYERFRSTNTINEGSVQYGKIHPRFGLSWKIDEAHTFRAAFQKRLYPGAVSSLAPLSTAGLVFDWIQLIPGSIITDYQTALESRWGDRLFTTLNLERRDVRNSETITGQENTTYFISAALNILMSDRLGAFVRYKYADSEIKDGLYIGKALPMLPKHAVGAGLIWVSPKYIKAMLSTYYISGQYGDYDNAYRLPPIRTTDLAITWETFRKHLLIRFEARNIFDKKYETRQGYPAPGRSAFLTMEYRF